MSLVSLLKGKGPNGFGYASTAEEVTRGLDLSGKTIMITGCNSGLGLESSRVLAERGARVLAAARTLEKAKSVAAKLPGNPLPLACELSDPRSIREAVQFVKQEASALDAIICNAGIMAVPELQQAFGYELQFFTNHIGHFILVTSLLDRLAERGRVVVLSSDAHRAAPPGGIQFDNLSGQKRYQPWMAYGQSKIANLLFAKELAKRLKSPEQSANAVHPGVIKTNLQRTMPKLVQHLMPLAEPLFLKTIPQGAATQCYVAVHPKVAESGEYFADCNVKKPRKAATDPELAQKLWTVSENIVEEVNAKLGLGNASML
jgi:NAD(P)-dependent dehydrogenase (short-subunit alcohol dehydrogenase family)